MLCVDIVTFPISIELQYLMYQRRFTRLIHRLLLVFFTNLNLTEFFSIVQPYFYLFFNKLASEFEFDLQDTSPNYYLHILGKCRNRYVVKLVSNFQQFCFAGATLGNVHLNQLDEFLFVSSFRHSNRLIDFPRSYKGPYIHGFFPDAATLTT